MGFLHKILNYKQKVYIQHTSQKKESEATITISKQQSLQILVPLNLSSNSSYSFLFCFDMAIVSPNIVLHKGGKELLPQDVTNLISIYYPLFGLTSAFMTQFSKFVQFCHSDSL